MPDKQFQGDHASLDGLPEADIISDQQIDSWHLERADHGIKLVVLDVDARTERSVNGADVGCRGGSPAYRVEESIQLVRGIEACGIWQRYFFDKPRSGLKLPDDLELFAQAVVLNRRERQQVLS